MEKKWVRYFAILFVLLVITWLNLSKNVGTWVKAGAVPAVLYFWSAQTWFAVAYVLLFLLFAALLRASASRNLAIMPPTALGRGQFFYLIFLWWVVIGNFERALVGFADQRLITEGVIFLNATFCTGLILLAPAGDKEPPEIQRPFSIRKLLVLGVGAFLFFTPGAWVLIRIAYGNKPPPQANLHIRFGPNATATSAPPSPNKPHP
jgi:hypothetical protein